MLKTSKIA